MRIPRRLVITLGLVLGLSVLQGCIPPVALRQRSLRVWPHTEPENLNPVLDPIRQKYKLPGLTGAIIYGNRIVGLGAVGIRRVGSDQPVTLEDQWHIGSCTKAMTASLIARLVEQGKLSWDTTIAEVFPELSQTMDPAYQQVTITQLLSHQSGAPGKLGPDRSWLDAPTVAQQRWDLVQQVLSRPPEAPPGTKMIYSNAGYVIAGAMAEKVTGKSWETLMRQEVFEPLGMASAGFGPPGKRWGTSQGAVDQPRGHLSLWLLRVPTFADNPLAIGPAGTVHLSMRDWAKFVAAHLQGARGQGGFLKTSSFQKLHTSPSGYDYGLGWGVTTRRWAGGPVLVHHGSNTMWFATVWLAPKRNFAVLVATNQGLAVGENACDQAAWALIQHLGADHH